MREAQGWGHRRHTPTLYANGQGLFYGMLPGDKNGLVGRRRSCAEREAEGHPFDVTLTADLD